MSAKQLANPRVSIMRGLQVRYVNVTALEPYDRNPRTHSNKQIRQIADSICTFGFTNPILIRPDGGIIAGHGRFEAAKLLGMEEVPTIRLDDLTAEQVRAYIIADNKLAENASWDRELLAIEFQSLTELEIDFDVSITGFEAAEIDLLIEDLAPSGNDEEDDRIPEVETAGPAVTVAGDLWQLGHHRLLCGDATDTKSFERLMQGRAAQMVFVDPPYNLAIDGHVSGLGRTKHANFAMASGEMSSEEFTRFLEAALHHLAANSADGSIHFVFMDWRHLGELTTAGRSAYSELKNLCIWVKTNAGMGTFYRSQHELVLVFKSGKAPHINNFELGQYGRHRSNVWRYPGVNTFYEGRLEELATHPTPKPVALVADAILDCSKRKGIILDSFAGSGTMLIAAEKTGRHGYSMELDPRYVDCAIRRWQEFTGQSAVIAETSQTFAEIEAARSGRSVNRPATSSTMPRNEETAHGQRI